MNTAGKFSAYGVVLALVAVGAWAIGTAVGPLNSSADPAEAHGAEGAEHGDTHSAIVAGTARPDEPAGLASSRGGYTLTPTSTTVTPRTSAASAGVSRVNSSIHRLGLACRAASRGHAALLPVSEPRLQVVA